MRNIDIRVFCRVDFSKWSFIEISDHRSRFFGAVAVVVCWAHEAAAGAVGLYCDVLGAVIRTRCAVETTFLACRFRLFGLLRPLEALSRMNFPAPGD